MIGLITDMHKDKQIIQLITTSMMRLLTIEDIPL